MPVLVKDGTLHFGDIKIPTANVSELVNHYDRHVPHTSHVEQVGKKLIASHFAEHETVVFVLCVCSWGGNQFDRAAKILKGNSINEISQCLRSAHETILSGARLQGDAIRCMSQLRQMGVSYQSKHLMFLDPIHCATLDSIVRVLGYEESQEGYQRWCDHCARVAFALAEKQVANPRRASLPEWRAIDVDSAVFAVLNKWDKVGS